MKIYVTGCRGIPDIPGGVETHCQELYPRIVQKGHCVEICTRIPYVKEKKNYFKGVGLVHVYATKRKSLETICHTFFSLAVAIRHKPDVIHFQGIGPSLLVPVARLMGYKVVMTNHGPEYDRQKWGPLARWVLRTGEYLGGKFSHEVIVISEIIENIVHKRCGKNANLIFNGVPIPEKRVETCHLDGIGVSKNNYFLAVARFVPEKGLHDLVKAFQHVQGEFKLVIAGDADHETAYSNHLKSLVQKDPRIKLTGYVNGEYLSQLYSNAALFVLPSYHEGLPIALLEAMSYGCPPLVSDIPANRAVDLDPRYYFPCGDVRALGKKLCSFIDRPISGVKRAAFQGIVADKYNWDVIAHQTLAVYEKLIL